VNNYTFAGVQSRQLVHFFAFWQIRGVLIFYYLIILCASFAPKLPQAKKTPRQSGMFFYASYAPFIQFNV
jgi:hypothetical protein